MLDYQVKSEVMKPWQEGKDPYRIWLFEIIMQQTRMQQGYPYYQKIVAKCPTVEKLADATEDELFSLWKGLGYYSRARNLHHTAKYIANNLEGVFPNNYTDLLKLKGVGEYTAAAIASFAFDEDVAVLDGNVHRVLSRYFGIAKTIQSSVDKKEFQSLANDLLIRGRSADFNQAMMDLGASLCSRNKPVCQECPLQQDCQAFLLDKTVEYPHRKPKKKIPTKQATMLLDINKSKQLLLIKRNLLKQK